MIGSLASAVSQYLTQPVCSDIRALAQHVADLSKTGADPGGGEEQFRSALEALRVALGLRREQNDQANQFADDPELVQEFLVEAREHLAEVESGILTLEREPGNTEALNAVFRSFHTIKGLSGFMGAAAVQELAHATEDVLDLARSGKLVLSHEIIELILKSADELNRCLDRARTCRLSDLPRCSQDLLASVTAIARSSSEPVTRSPVHCPAENTTLLRH
jgi:HPt (histidine-containing phosphotransfer) domain-containing protein